MGIPTPNFGLIEQAHPNVLRDYAEMTAIKGMRQQQAQRAQLAPSQVQQAQAQAGLSQTELENQKMLQHAFSPEASLAPAPPASPGATAAGTEPAATSSVPASPSAGSDDLLDRLQGAGPLGVAAAGNLVKLREGMATLGKTNAETAGLRNDMLAYAASVAANGLKSGVDPQKVLGGLESTISSDPFLTAKVNADVQRVGPAGIMSLLDSYMGNSKAFQNNLRQQQLAKATEDRQTPASLALKAAQGDTVAQAALDKLASSKSQSASLLEMQDWMKQNPGKGPADFMKWQISMRPEFPRVVAVPDAHGNTVGFATFTGTASGVRPAFTAASAIPGMPQNLGSVPGVIPPKPTGTILTQSQRANMIEPQVAAISNSIDSIKSQLGPAVGRWNDLMTGKIGTNNPEFAKLGLKLELFSTALMQAHGLRGEQYEKTLMNYFRSSQSPDNLKARLQGANDYLNDYIGATGHGPAAPAGQQQGNAPGGNVISWKDLK